MALRRTSSNFKLRERSQRRLLFLLPFAPRLDASHGGSRVIAHVIANLALRHRLALLFFRANEEHPVDDVLRDRCEFVEEVIRPGTGSSILQQTLRRMRLITSLFCGKPMMVTRWKSAKYAVRARALAQTWQPDIVQIEYHIMGQYLSALAGCPAPRVLVEHEPGIHAARDIWMSQHGLARTVSWLDMWAWQRFEPAVLRKAQAVVVLTERDRQALAAFGMPAPVVKIPLGTELPECPLDPVGTLPPSVLFFGNFIHPPNVDAALRLVNGIFPRIRIRYPEVKLFIVGDQPPLQLRQAANDAVIITGYVPVITPFLDRAAVVAVPLHIGGGMRVKVLETLAAGKALVASPLAIEGLNLVDGEQFVLAESDQQFCDAIIHLLANPKRRVELAMRARAWASVNLRWENSIAAYEELYDNLSKDKS